MSTHTEQSEWSPEDVDSLENIDKEVQLVSTSSDSYSTSNYTKNKETLNNSQVKLDSNLKVQTVAKQSKNQKGTLLPSKQSNNSKELHLKLHSSCDDLSLWSENKLDFDFRGVQDNHSIKCSNNSVNFKSSKKSNINKYTHVESKVKPFFNNNINSCNCKTSRGPQKQKNTVISEVKENSNKEEYLEEINKQLSKELDEKNAILTLLQENYEHLLFKYAEAQNRIDELRFKFMSEPNESKNYLFNKEYNGIGNGTSYFHCDEEHFDKSSNMKFQKATIPFNKREKSVYGTVNNSQPPIMRPSTLPLEKFFDRDLIKATTPTDSEGLSSIITSMSGHSKILNSLDEEKLVNKKSQSGNFILEGTPPVNDPFDKVKNWQNSLPPLEQIETPETTLYNVFSNNKEDTSPAETKYKDIPSPKTDDDYNFLDESCPSSWREDKDIEFHKNNSNRTDLEDYCKISLRASSLPNTLKKRTIESQIFSKTHHSLDLCAPENKYFSDSCFTDKPKHDENDIPPPKVFNSVKKPRPLLRCSSLPTYDYDDINSSEYRNGIYIPPLNLANITLSEDESSSPNNYYNKSIGPTASSFISSRGTSVDRSIQTPQSFSSCKATISKENSFSRVPKTTANKSTSITPDRSSFFDSNSEKLRELFRSKTSASFPKECSRCCSDKSKSWCNVCGETICENKSVQFFLSKSNSCESIGKSKNSFEDSKMRLKPPFTRSVSFNSETKGENYCQHHEKIISEPYHDSLEYFEIYAKNLKARSRVVMKALTAHVNNS